mgnify:CR=1 FL=1
MTNRKSIFPSQPAGCCGPKSGTSMPHPLDPVLALALVDDAVVDVEVELSAADPVDEEFAAEVSDSAGTVVTAGWVTPPKLDAPVPPPQAEIALVRARARRVPMGAMSLANLPAAVMCWVLICQLGAKLCCDDVRPAQDENTRLRVEGAKGSLVER